MESGSRTILRRAAVLAALLALATPSMALAKHDKSPSHGAKPTKPAKPAKQPKPGKRP